MLKILICGVALSSLWFWAFALARKEISTSMLKWWLKVIVPQGVLVAFALALVGIL